jgi:hypothetical protein
MIYIPYIYKAAARGLHFYVRTPPPHAQRDTNTHTHTHTHTRAWPAKRFVMAPVLAMLANIY